MVVIGLESSAHTFGVGIIDDGKILANEKSMYKIGSSGMIPAKVAEFHIKNAHNVIERALSVAGISINELDGVGYTKGPGLGPCLQVAELAAKTLACKLNISIAPVNHCVGHIEITKHMTGLKDPVTLYVSGGNSQILKLATYPFRHYTVLGETFDVGVGNMLDAFARNLKLEHAWGSSIEKLAVGGAYTPLPYTVKGMDFSFTGLLTKATELISSTKRNDLCYSLQETAFSVMCEAVERALLLTNSNEICVCGGVAQNKRLQQMLELVAKEHNGKFGCAENQFNADNGAMIAYVAENMLKKGYRISLSKCNTMQRYRTDSAEVFEREG